MSEKQDQSELDEAEIVDAEVLESSRNEPTQPAAPIGPSRIALILAVLAIFGVTAGLGFGYQHVKTLEASLLKMNQTISDTGQQQTALQSELNKTRQAFDAQKEKLDIQKQALSDQDKRLVEEQNKLRQQRSEMQETLEKVYRRVGRNSTAWMAAEAEYLILVANHRLQLEGDVATAIKALEAADSRLRDIGDPGWSGVRERLAAEIASLKGVGALDRTGLAAKLAGMAMQIKGLKMVGIRPAPAPAESDLKVTESGERTFKTMINDGWEGFKSVMVIRHHDKPVNAMLPPEQQYFVYQNLELQLESARLALLRGDQALYTASLQTVDQWLKEFFNIESNATKALLGQISELQAIVLNPDLPDISKSLIALRGRLKSGTGGAE